MRLKIQVEINHRFGINILQAENENNSSDNTLGISCSGVKSRPLVLDNKGMLPRDSAEWEVLQM